jgi:hypothetical protein
MTYLIILTSLLFIPQITLIGLKFPKNSKKLYNDFEHRAYFPGNNL